MPKSVKKNLLILIVILAVAGGLIALALKCVKFEGFIPRDIYLEQKDTKYSAPIGGFIFLTVGLAFSFWLISAVIECARKWKEKKDEKKNVSSPDPKDRIA